MNNTKVSTIWTEMSLDLDRKGAVLYSTNPFPNCFQSMFGGFERVSSGIGLQEVDAASLIAA